jgi:hypothetical protein
MTQAADGCEDQAEVGGDGACTKVGIKRWGVTEVPHSHVQLSAGQR